MRICSCFRSQYLVFSVFQCIRNLTVGIVEVAEIHTFCRANRHARWFFAFGDTMVAERAFINVTFRMRISGIIRARLDAGSTADTFIRCNQYNASFDNVAGTGGAAANAGRVVAMVATFGAQFDFDIWIASVNSFGYPVAAVADGHVILGLAGDNTIAATNAFSGINGHCVSHDLTSFRGSSVINVTKLPLKPVPPIIGSICTFVIISLSLTPFPKARLSFLSVWPKP